MSACQSAGSVMETRTVQMELTRPSLLAAVSPQRAACVVGPGMELGRSTAASGAQPHRLGLREQHGLPLGLQGVWGAGADSGASLQCTTTRVTSGSSCAGTASAFPSILSATTMTTAAMARMSLQSVVGVTEWGGGM